MIKYFLFLAAIASIATSFSLVDPITYIYKTVENLNILADVYIPDIAPQDKYPVVLAMHGGGFVGGTKQGGCSTQELNEMLSRGWVVVSVDYRLAPDIILGDIVQDVQDAYAWIRNDLANIVPLDLDSFIVMGNSAGGGLAVISGYMLSPRPQAIIAFYPGCTNYTESFEYNSSSPVPEILVQEMEALMQPLTEYNLTGDANDTRSTFFNTAVQDQKVGWMLATHDPNEPANLILDYLQNYSAVFHIDSSYPPTVLIHGFDDTLVPHEQSVEMAGCLAKANVPYRLNLVPGAGHAFDFGNITTQVWDDFILTAFNFAERYLKTSSIVDYDILQ